MSDPIAISDLDNVDGSDLMRYPDAENIIIENCVNVFENTFYGCPNVKSLCFKECRNIHRNCIKMLKKLEALYIIDCGKVYNDFVPPQIDTLAITKTNCLDDQIFKHASNLSTLSINNNSSITGEGFVHLSSLDELHLLNLINIKQHTFIYLSYIESLILYNINIRENTLLPLTSLKYLAIDGIPNFTGRILESIDTLKKLIAVNCDEISYDKLCGAKSIISYKISECKNITRKQKIKLWARGLLRKTFKNIECINNT